MKTSLLTFCCLIVCAITASAQEAGRYEIGMSYRYQRYTTGAFWRESLQFESMHPHGIDLNFRFDIGDPRLRGTLILGWSKLESVKVDYHGLDNILNECGGHYEFDVTVREQNYLRINPGVEFAKERGKVSYGYGVGVYVISSFAGFEATTYTDAWSHTDSVTGDCVEDSTRISVVIGNAKGKAVHIVGVSAHLFTGYEFYPGITCFASFGVNPCFSLREKFVALAPHASVGIYYRFKRQSVH